MNDPELHESKTRGFLDQVVIDWAAGISAVMVHLGDKLGLYRAMAGAGPLTSTELARRTATTERYIREWLGNQAAGGYVRYDPATGRYELPAEHAACLVDEDALGFALGGFDIVAAAWAAEPIIREAFRTGEGVGWHEHDPRLYAGTRRLSSPSFRTYLTTEWVAALGGVGDTLRTGGRVADVGCGHRASTILMAEAFPRSVFTGYDYHDASIAAARKAASQAGVSERVSFEVATAKDLPAEGYDLVTLFECLHDLGDPVGAARHVRAALAPDGALMVVEPNAADTIEDNVHPLGRALYGLSAVFCTATSLSQDVGFALGAAAGEACLQGVLAEAGFTRIRRATETRFHMVLEARPQERGMSQHEQPAVGLDAEVDEALRAGLRRRLVMPGDPTTGSSPSGVGSTSWVGRYADGRVGETAFGHRDPQFLVHVGGTAEQGSNGVDRDWAPGRMVGTSSP